MNKMKSRLIKIMMVLGVLFLVGCSNSNGATGSAVADQLQLSGSLVAMDPGRSMAGAPCHVMGGTVMGDCQTREVQLEVFRYGWSEPTIVVKTGELVRISAISSDVDHGFSIPAVSFDMQITAGKEVSGQFLAPAVGEYVFGCSVMCGPGHHNHRGKLVVVA